MSFKYLYKTRPAALTAKCAAGAFGTRWAAAISLAFVLLACAPSDSEPGEILVFAAASLADALQEIGSEYEASSGARVAFSFGGSQTLAQQVAGGAPADIVIAAGENPMQFLIDKNLVRSEPIDLLTNRLVVAVQRGADQPKTLQDLASPTFSRVAIAGPDLAPAGTYARQALKQLGLWEQLQEKMVFGPDVSATLAYVESGNVDAAIVYGTDARASSRVAVLDIVPADSYSPIVYPAALVHEAPNESAAKLFLEFLEGPQATRIFQNFGFQPAQ